MAQLYLTEQELKQTTILGGNVDPEKYRYIIEMVQETEIQQLLGTELKDKIDADLLADTLAGDYLTLYTSYIKPITKYLSCAKYIEYGQYNVTNAGIYKHTSENSEIVSKDEVSILANDYRSRANGYVIQFEKWICKNTLTEYKTYQDDVNARDISVTGGWFLKY